MTSKPAYPFSVTAYQWFYRQAPIHYMVLALVFLGSLLVLGGQEQSVQALPSPMAHMDKVYHFMAFSTLATLGWFYFKGTQAWRVIAAVALAGVLDETHQAFLSFRTADIADLATDIGAALVAVTLLRALHRFVGRHDPSFFRLACSR